MKNIDNLKVESFGFFLKKSIETFRAMERAEKEFNFELVLKLKNEFDLLHGRAEKLLKEMRAELRA